MAGMMDIDLPPLPPAALLSPRDRILRRLVQHGVPEDRLGLSPQNLVAIVTDNPSSIPELVPLILPTDADVSEVQRSSSKNSVGGAKELLGESMLWLQWLMFKAEPQSCLKSLAQNAAGERAVCGSVWGQNDLAYRCRTCEHDPTCAICVSCFQNGNHKDHDYSIMYTGGGCCDCGDETAWKREGFCSKHKGAAQIRPLNEELAASVGPVLDALLACWREKVLAAELRRAGREGDDSTDLEGKFACKLTSAVVKMLLNFCNCSESLLSFVSRRMFECSGLLDVLVRAERLLGESVVRELHELLLKLLGEPLFKYEFAKAFIKYYPFTVNEILKQTSETTVEKYPLLPTFSVQIFTVPTLTPRLVREVNLLGVLLGCLRDLLLSCVSEDGHLQATKLEKIHETTIRLVEDTRYVMSHSEVPIYIARERPDISRSWLNLLSIVQGMDAQRRLTGLHAEEENDILVPFLLSHYLGNVNTLLAGGAFPGVELKETKDTTLYCSDIHGLDDNDMQRHAKVGRLSQESSACSVTGRTDGRNFGNLSIPSSAVWLIIECLKAIESWLAPDAALRSNLYYPDATSSRASNVLDFRKRLCKFGMGANSSSIFRTSTGWVDRSGDQVSLPSERYERFHSFPNVHGMPDCLEPEKRVVLAHNNDPLDVRDMNDMYSEHDGEIESGPELEVFSILKLADWPNITYDVSSHEISFHIPLHRLLSLLLRKALRNCYGENGEFIRAYGISIFSSSRLHDFFQQVLVGLEPCGFSAFIMEHPLRLRVCCAQVRAGMWRKNGDAAILSSEWYRSVQWLEQGIESDLFLLQCCAALSPPEFFVKRIQERFGLSNYTSLNLADYTEYEPVLVQEMLTLIIQIVKERRFCGSSSSENLRRELVYKLAVGDATHSQLVKSLPRDLSKSDQLQNIVDMLAVYSNPAGLKQGKYTLRKEFWKELDLYHPRWNSRDLQVAEERYFRFCKVSALNVQLPRWTEVSEPLSTIWKIATSKAVLLIVRAVIFYAVFTKVFSISRAPDGVVITALHLVSLALDICQNEICRNKASPSAHLSYRDDQSFVDVTHDAEDMFPILMYANEEFDADSTDEVMWNNQSMLSLLVSLMRKCKEGNGTHYVERRQCNISSLIETLLKKFAQLSPKCLENLKRLAPDVVCSMPQHSANSGMQKASTSDVDDRRAKARARQAAVMEKMKAEQSKFIASLKIAASEEPGNLKSKQEVSIQDTEHVPGESVPVCSLCRDTDSGSPLCFLILLQKSKLTSFVERGPPSWEEVGQSGKVIHSAEKEAVSNPSVADSSSPMQMTLHAGLDVPYETEPVEVDAFQDFFNDQLSDIRSIQPATASYGSSTNSASPFEMMEIEIFQTIKGICSLSHLTAQKDGEKHSSSNDLDLKGSKDMEPSVHSEYVESLSGVSLEQKQSSIHCLNVANMPPESTIPIAKFKGFGPRDCDGIHISSCGHAVHQECHDRYLTSLKQRHNRRLGFEGGHIVDPDLGELLCPVCRRFANAILPAFPGSTNKSWGRMMSSVSSLTATVVPCTLSNMDNTNLLLPLAISLLRCTAEMVRPSRFQKVFSGKQTVSIEPALEPILHKLCLLFYSNSYDTLSAFGRLSESLILWDTLRYSLISGEIAARGRLSIGSLEALYGELHSSSGFILSLLFQAAQTTRSLNRRDVIMRFRGIQLFVESICSGVSGDKNFLNSDKRRGTFLSILERAEKRDVFSDIQLCKRAADPILAHDPFSSLMWVLFCLPFPYVSCREFFTPLVHLFYAVCVVQGMITCYNKTLVDESCFGDCRFINICEMIGKSDLSRKYFVSNHIDSSCNPKDMIRRLTFPYLRRCALLWKLLQSATAAPLYDSSSTLDGSITYTNINLSDTTNCLKVELNRIRELEDLFQINSAELVFKDDAFNVLALRWCLHFCKQFSVRKCGATLFSSPAVPFRLMQLPRLYQELLQRYVKQQCSDCKYVPDEPALCLLCGKLCSPGWKACCRTSRCLSHALVCGAGIGVFLLVRRTTILLQRSSRQAFWPSPYLDAFGEEDRDMYRGRPLYLSEERYAALTYLVASHGLDHSSEVLRQTTIGLFDAD